jgi:hydrophobe/amphiphile efflux-3 (HAE3) family protein
LRSFFPDSTHALLAATVVGNASLDELALGSEAIKDSVGGREFENASVIITGTPTFLTDINDYLQGGMLTLGAIALGVMLIVLAVAFPVRWRLLPLASVVAGVIWGFGIFGYLGIGLSLVTISGLPILIGIGIDFAIQVHARVEEECGVRPDTSPFAETLARMGPPLMMALIAAVIAFMVMQISRVPMIRDFGVLLSIGIISLLAAGAAITVSVMATREAKSPAQGVSEDGVIDRAVVRLGSLPRVAIPALVALAVVLPVLGLILEGGSEIESDPINWADQGSDSVINARQLEDEVGFATTMGVFIETDGSSENGIFTDEMAAFVHDAAQANLESEPTLVQASSLVTTVSYLLEIPGATPLPPTGADLLAAYAVAPPGVQRLLVGPDGNTAQILFRVGPSSLDDRAGLIERLEVNLADPGDGAARPEDSSVTVAGLARVGVGLLNNLEANRSALTVVALLLVAAWLVARSGSVAQAALTMVPILLAVGASATVVSVLGITLSPLTTVGGPLVIATCAEFSVLLIARYKDERRRGLDAVEASAMASRRTGRAFTASALTTIGGFGVLIFAALPLLQDFGAIVTLNIAIALLSALVVVPPLVVWADERGFFVADTPVGERVQMGPATALAGVTFLALVIAGGLIIADASEDPAEAALSVVTVPAGTPATVPPPTTAPPTTEAPAAGDTLPPGPAERPGGLVAGAIYDAFAGAGVDPGVARCAADELVTRTPEADLLALGIAGDPRPPEASALIVEAALACGVPQEVLAALAGSPPPSDDETTTATTLPPGPAERPATLVAGAIYDAFAGAGVDPGVARCAADALVEKTPEADLLGLGIASVPRPDEANALIVEAALACGISQDVLDALAGATG